MKTVKHPAETRNLGAPRGWDHAKVECGGLSIRDDSSNGYPVMKSRWEPDGIEAIAIALGSAQIELGVWNSVHPPVSVICHPVGGWTSDRAAMARAYDRVLRQLLKHAEENGLVLAEGGVAIPTKTAAFADTKAAEVPSGESP